MKTLLAIVVTISCFISQAQKIEKFYDADGKLTTDLQKARYFSVIENKKGLWQEQCFYVYEKTIRSTGSYVDSSLKTKQGDFIWFYPNGDLERKGRFENGEQVGTWVSFHHNGIMRDSAFYVNGEKTGISLSWHFSGYMSDSVVNNADGSGVIVEWFDNGNPSCAGRLKQGGEMSGKWQYFHRNGKLSAIEMYENGKMISEEVFDEKGIKQEEAEQDRPAGFPGGPAAWKKFMEKQLYWPHDVRFTTEGRATVFVTLAINEDGKVADAYVSLGFHPEFDKIALKAVKQSPKWVPAVSHNRKIKTYVTQAINFTQTD